MLRGMHLSTTFADAQQAVIPASAGATNKELAAVVTAMELGRAATRQWQTISMQEITDYCNSTGLQTITGNGMTVVPTNVADMTPMTMTDE